MPDSDYHAGGRRRRFGATTVTRYTFVPGCTGHGGFDGDGRNANLLAFLWPERVKALVSVSGYVVGSQAPVQMLQPASAEPPQNYLPAAKTRE